jgi:hypothetical protein
MRSPLARPLGRLLGSLGSGVRGRRVLASCLVLGAVGGLAGAEGAGGQEYSAFADPQKPVISVLLSEEGNVREFRETFGLEDSEMEKVLRITRAENGRLAEEHAQSETLIEANRSLSKEKISEKIAASDYDETVSSAVEGTKDDIAALLPEGGRDQLAVWVDEQWRQEVAEASEGSSARIVESKGRGSLVCGRIYATQYVGYTRFEAALPHRDLKFGKRPQVPIIRGNRSIRPRIKEVGPWNTYDNYWRSGKNRDMWKGLRQCVPEARAAYYNEYNRGKDEFGREVLNPAGVDLTPAAARKLGLRKYQNAWVAVRFPWLPRR